MTTKQRILISIAALFLLSLFFFIVLGEHGLVDLNQLKKERDEVVEKNEQLTRENLDILPDKEGNIYIDCTVAYVRN